ncbi:MAG: GNAT family N-acetyltransferase [Candidatus Hodarchaeales archaeon]
MNYKIVEFEPKTTSEELWKHFHEFREKLFVEIYPDDPIHSKEWVEKVLKNPNPNYDIYRWFIQAGNRTVIGWGYISLTNEKSPEYEINNNIANAVIFIDRDHRDNGLGTDLLKILVKRIRSEDRSTIEAGTLLESGHCFCKKMGGIKALDDVQNRLQMTDVNWEMIDEWRVVGPERAEGTSLEWFNTVSDEDIEEYCKIYTETMNQQPFGEIDSRVKVTPETRRLSEKRTKDSGGIWTTLISREKDRTISGLTEVIYYPDRPSILHQNLTGVDENYRGRGLGKWLKAEMLAWIKNEYPVVKTIMTGNSTTNAPMLSINRRLGFKEYKSGSEYKFNVEELAQKLEI